MKNFLPIIVPIMLMLLSCQQGSVNQPADGDTLEMNYAENVCIVHYDNYTKVEMKDPWKKGQILHTYILIDKNAKEDHLPEGTIVHVPLKKATIYTSVHCSLVDELGAAKSIKAVCDIQYIHDKYILQACKQGKVVDLGNSTAPNIEAIIDISPDAIMLSPFENSGGYGQIEKLGIPIIECADYMETSALGRAEWMKFYGLLFDKEKEAVKLFSNVEKNYNELKEQASSIKNHPIVICDDITGSTWYVPGANSTTGQLIKDAGGDYVFKDRPESGSIPLAPETVFDKSQNADVWFLKYTKPTDMTLKDLSKESPMYSKMNAFKNGNVYGCNLSYSLFYEDLPFRPDKHLKDLIKIFHPEALPEYKTKYYKMLKN